MKKWIFNAWYIKRDKQLYRFLTSGFIHKDWSHLAFNMFTLYFLGNGVELYFEIYFPGMSTLLLLTLYISAIIISSIPGYFKHKDEPHYNSLGASGGVSALVFCFIILAPTTPLCLLGILCFPGFIIGTVYLIYTIRMSKTRMDNINHEAHLWGAVFGMLFLLFVDYNVYLRFIEEVVNYNYF
ncbi:MAG: rhomboid family intramembrane serine protease [Cyclobacteriaceae bacterium]|nr:rhomboid family intramembrane serine protease [Cyclobacteriaceae bacterium]